MTNVHTLNDINNKSNGFFKGVGQRLGGVYEQEFKEKLYSALKSKAEINDLSEKLIDKYNEREKEFENKASQLIAFTTKIKTLKRKATLTQKASSIDKDTILSLEAKVRELEGGVVEESVQMPKLPDWLHDNLRSIVCELGLEDKVIELDKKLAKEDILEVLQKVISEKDYRLQDANIRLEKALSEKDFLLHEANTRIKKHLTNFEKNPSPDSFETQHCPTCAHLLVQKQGKLIP
ncbi:hypothetical protein C1645_737364 [Glomus cerebriforme]|uniref:Uncharacterized protein n=1 Tax=Glomus cerebriforme TaxID=658196 RepID=A0A397T4N0_9GLOM|nr:hypothetical protein C1645_737364 [Glomus cerebriforme]